MEPDSSRSDAPPPGYVTQSADTSYAAERLLFQRWRSMDLDEKAALIAQASRDLHALCLAGLRHRLPAASERELALRAMALKYGKELVRRTLAWTCRTRVSAFHDDAGGAGLHLDSHTRLQTRAEAERDPGPRGRIVLFQD